VAQHPGWQRFAHSRFSVEFSYPAVTPTGQAVERAEEEVDDHRGHMERVHLSSPDRRELYVEVARFHGIEPEDEYQNHTPYLRQRFGDDAVTELTDTHFAGLRASTYSFQWDEDGRPMERAARLLHVAGDTYRVIYDPRSELNEQVLSTIAIRE
jgi:hypothetical protein